MPRRGETSGFPPSESPFHPAFGVDVEHGRPDAASAPRNRLKGKTRTPTSFALRMLRRMTVCSARLSCRSPARLSQCRTVWPPEAGIGATSASRAKAASERTLHLLSRSRSGRTRASSSRAIPASSPPATASKRDGLRSASCGSRWGSGPSPSSEARPEGQAADPSDPRGPSDVQSESFARVVPSGPAQIRLRRLRHPANAFEHNLSSPLACGVRQKASCDARFKILVS